MRICVTGGRAHADQALVWDTLDDFARKHGIEELGHGNAGKVAPLTGRVLGVDLQAKLWCQHNSVEQRPYIARWNEYGRGAGPERNRRMLDDFKPDALLVFPGGAGTADCRQAALERGIDVLVIPPRPEELIVGPEPPKKYVDDPGFRAED